MSPPFGEEHRSLEQDISFPANEHLLMLGKCYAVHIIILILYYRLAEHINRYMTVVQYIVSSTTTDKSATTKRRAQITMASNENEFVRSILHLKPVEL